GGCNVLYMDGHVKFVKYIPGGGAPFPCCAGFAGLTVAFG
ncbi:MAG: hypothetical protein JXR94_13035, partial [Candidatus Hydrogenedentes bacterium]|nr:hypothetical protein [Candidatus Hydrogenedentota bacterium]